jgi:hypothetical protein
MAKVIATYGMWYRLVKNQKRGALAASFRQHTPFIRFGRRPIYCKPGSTPTTGNLAKHTTT